MVRSLGSGRAPQGNIDDSIDPDRADRGAAAVGAEA
jgi:hypothetical protein